jgi:hypothetical protein
VALINGVVVGANSLACYVRVQPRCMLRSEHRSPEAVALVNGVVVGRGCQDLSNSQAKPAHVHTRQDNSKLQQSQSGGDARVFIAAT